MKKRRTTNMLDDFTLGGTKCGHEDELTEFSVGEREHVKKHHKKHTKKKSKKSKR